MKKRERNEDDINDDANEGDAEERTKQTTSKKLSALVMNCAVTGYAHGDYLKGNPGRAEGGVIRVWFADDDANVDVPNERRAQAQGRYVAPIRVRCERAIEDHADAYLEKLRAFSLFRDAPDTRSRLEEVWFPGKSHDSIGCGFGGMVLLEVLVLPKKIKQLFDDQPDHQENLERIMTQRLTAEELLDLLPRKSTSSKSSMVLHASEWSVATWKSLSHVDAPLCVVSLEHGTVEQARPGERCSPQHELWAVPGLAESWKAKKSNAGARHMERVSTQTVMFCSPHVNQRLERADTLRCLTMLDIPHSQEDVARLQGSLQGICTAGLCKSLMQKLLRFQAMQCDLGGGVYVSAEVALVHVMCALYNSAGQFNPDIQRWISGVESLCKRLGVILFEDSTYTDPRDSVRLLGAAVLSQHVPVWRPSESLFLHWLRVALQALGKRDAYVYDSKFSGQNFVVRSDAHPFQVASALLDECGSFAGDENMARHIASREGNDQVRAKAERPLTMPSPEHALDQHTCPSMVYLFPPALVNEWATTASASAPFAPVMAQLFQSVTGFNPRRTRVDWTLFEVENADIRNAQCDMLRWLRRKGTVSERRLVMVDKGRVAVKLEPLSDEWIAGMVGQVEQDRYYVSLRPSNPTSLVAMPKPARGKTLQDAGEEEDSAAHAAVAKVKERFKTDGLRLQSHVDGRFSECVGVVLSPDEDEILLRFQDGTMIPWSQARQFEDLLLPVHAALPLSHGDVAFGFRGTGIEDGAWQKFRNFLEKSISPLAVFRLSNYMSCKAGSIELPGVSRDGGSLKGLVSLVDVEVCHALLCVCVLFPAALEVSEKPFSFNVLMRPLLWKLNEIVLEVLDSHRQHGVESQWPAIVDSRNYVLMEHQKESLERMLHSFRNSIRGSFLHIPVGLGKTFILLSFLKSLADARELPPYVLYVLPRSAMLSVLSEIAAFRGLFADVLLPVGGASKVSSLRLPTNARFVRGQFVQLNPHRITLVEDDYVRLIGDAVLPQLHQCVCFVDEVHKKMASTQRTSWTLNWAQNSRFFVALTGTPVIDSNATGLLDWFKLCVQFDCNPRNMWIASADMIAYRVSTGVIVDRTAVKGSLDEDFTPQERASYLARCPVAMGGLNSNAKREDLDVLTEISYNVCTRIMLSLVRAFLDKGEGDRKWLEGANMVHVANVDLSTDEVQCGVRLEVHPHQAHNAWRVCGRVQPNLESRQLSIDCGTDEGAQILDVNSEGVFEFAVLANSPLMNAFRLGQARVAKVPVKPVFPPERVMVVAKDDAHASFIEAELAGSLGPQVVHKGILHLTDAEVIKDPNLSQIRVVIVPMSKPEGYTLTRCGVQIQCVYPSNQAKREQIEGRINRLGQARQTIRYVMVHTGILSYILEKHLKAASLSAALVALQQDISSQETVQVLGRLQ